MSIVIATLIVGYVCVYAILAYREFKRLPKRPGYIEVRRGRR